MKMTAELHIYLRDEKLSKDFDEFILIEHGTLYAVKGDEVAKALKLYLALNDFKDYSDKVNLLDMIKDPDTATCNTQQKFNSRQKKILYAFEYKFLLDSKIPNKKLRNFIKKELKVIDPRTVNKWVKYLETIGVIYKEPRSKTWINTLPLNGADEILGIGIHE